jgi:hypothetical protein
MWTDCVPPTFSRERYARKGAERWRGLPSVDRLAMGRVRRHLTGQIGCVQEWHDVPIIVLPAEDLLKDVVRRIFSLLGSCERYRRSGGLFWF